MKTVTLLTALIKWRLGDLGVTARWLAKQLGQSESLTSMQISGQRRVSLRDLRRYSLALQIEADLLVAEMAPVAA